MSFEVALQTAIFNALDTALAVPVYDSAPDNAAAPYVVVGDDTVIEWDTDGKTGFEATITIHSWSEKRGRKEVKTLMGLIYTALHRVALTITGYTTDGAEFEFAQTFAEGDNITRHGVQRFRILARKV